MSSTEGLKEIEAYCTHCHCICIFFVYKEYLKCSQCGTQHTLPAELTDLQLKLYTVTMDPHHSQR